MEQPETVQIRKLKRIIGVRASTFRNFLNTFNLYDFPYSEFNADSHISYETGKFLVLNQYFINSYEKDYYSNKTPQEIATRIHRTEAEVLSYLKSTHPEYFKNGYYKAPENRPLRYKSSYLMDKKMGGNYRFLKLLQDEAKRSRMDLDYLYRFF